MPFEFKIPSGWTKGEPVTVGKRKVDGHPAWSIERASTCEKAPKLDDMAVVFFYSHEEFMGFMKWWFWA